MNWPIIRKHAMAEACSSQRRPKSWRYLKEVAGEKLPLFQNKNTRTGVAIRHEPESVIQITQIASFSETMLTDDLSHKAWTKWQILDFGLIIVSCRISCNIKRLKTSERVAINADFYVICSS
jgi:hypothetical protein